MNNKSENIHKEKKKHNQEGTITNMEDTQEVIVTHVTVHEHGTQDIGGELMEKTLGPNTQVSVLLKLCADDIMKNFDAMQYTTQQALTEMQQTLKGLERESGEAIASKFATV